MATTHIASSRHYFFTYYQKNLNIFRYCSLYIQIAIFHNKIVSIYY